MSATYTAEHLAQAAQLHERLIIFDAHVDLPIDFGEGAFPPDRDGPGQFDLAKARVGKLSGAGLVIHGPVGKSIPAMAASVRAEQEKRDGMIEALARDYPTQVGIAASPAELRKLKVDGLFAAVKTFQNAGPLENGLDGLAAWLDRGVAMVAFNFIGNNDWADSARPYPYIGGSLAWGGLSPLGKEAVALLNDRGVLVDASQSSSAALHDMIAASRLPVIASHAGARALVDIDRNLTDEDLGAIAGSGGVAHMVGFAPYLRTLDQAMIEKLAGLWNHWGLATPSTLSDYLSINDPATAGWADDRFFEFLHEFHVVLELEKPIAGVADLVCTIDHAVDKAGIDHVGISSDFNHAGGLTDWMHSGQTLNVTAGLLARGYDEASIAKLWAENFLRVWQVVLDGARP